MQLSHCLSSVFSTAQTNIPTKLVVVCILMMSVVENIPTKLVVEGHLTLMAYNSECGQRSLLGQFPQFVSQFNREILKLGDPERCHNLLGQIGLDNGSFPN